MIFLSKMRSFFAAGHLLEDSVGWQTSSEPGPIRQVQDDLEQLMAAWSGQKNHGKSMAVGWSFEWTNIWGNSTDLEFDMNLICM